MNEHENLVQLYSGSEIDAKVLQEVLEENQIASMVRNDMESGLAAGFGGGFSTSAAHVLVAEKDMEKAKIILEEFLNSFEKE